MLLNCEFRNTSMCHWLQASTNYHAPHQTVVDGNEVDRFWGGTQLLKATSWSIRV